MTLQFSKGGKAIKNTAQPVQSLNAGSDVTVRSLSQLDWNDLRFLLEVGRGGSLRAAAKQLLVSVNTVRARLARLERASGAPLLRRDFSGVKLTSAGRAIYEGAEEMSRARLRGDLESNDVLISPGRITLACTEGLGASWLTPRVPELSEAISPLTIDLQFDFDLDRDRSFAADVGLSYRPPPSPDLIVSKLATLHFMLFAAPSYLAKHGTPQTVDDLLSHHFVEQAAPGYNPSAVDLLLGADRPSNMTTVRTNSALTQAYAVANGAGIGILPSYTRGITNTLVPLPVLPNMRVPLVYYYHADAKHSKAVRAVIDWLRAAFDTEKYPWFADTFVHPDDFPKQKTTSDDGRVVSLFEHIVDRVALVR